MNQTNPSTSRRRILPECNRFTKISVLSTAIGTALLPMVMATGLVTETNTLTIAATGQFDLKDNALIVHSGGGLLGPILVPVTGYMATGLNFAGLPPGTPTNAFWDGYGINSSIAKGDGGDGTGTLVHGIGAILNQFDITLGGTPVFDITLPAIDDHQTFYGKTVGITDILASYTIMGDADLSGTVDAFDQFLLDNSIANGGLPGWLNGDFDYDGVVGAFDQFLIDNAIANGQTVPPPAPPFGAVPEPGAVSLLMMGLLGFVGRRSARQKTQN